MADNITIPAQGTGDTTPVVATDDVGGKHYQRVKVDLGGDGLASPLVRGQQAAADSIPVVLPSDQAAIPVTDNSGSLTVDYATTGSGNATGALRVELANNGTGRMATVDAVTAITNALPAGTNAIGKLAANSGVDIGDVDVTSVPTDPFGANADAASATGSISAKLRFIAGTGIPVTGTVTVGSHAVTNAGTFVVQEDGAALTALQLIDDAIFVDDTATHATGTTKGVGIMAAATPTDAAVGANDIGMVAMTTDRKLHVAVMDALPAGTAAIGKLAANSGVDIGDVDILSIAAGDNNIGNVDLASAIPAGTNNIGDVDVLTVPADPFGANADAASATGSISAKLRFIASTGIPVTGTVTVGSHAVTVASGGIASGAVASGAIASGAVASGAVASGAFASGSIASGAIAAGAIAAGATSIADNEDVASASADRGVKILAVQKATPANTADTDGDYEFLQLSIGHLWVAPPPVTKVSFNFNRPANTTAYAANDAVNDNATAGGGSSTELSWAIGRSSGIIRRVRIKKTDQTVATPTIRLWLYDTNFASGAGDNEAFVHPATDSIGFVDVAVTNAGTDDAVGWTNADIPFTGATLYGQLQTLSAFTPASGETFTIGLWYLPG